MRLAKKIIECIGLVRCCHALAGATIACAVAYAEASLGGTTGASWGLVAAYATGVARELSGNTQDWRDMLATAIGGLAPLVIDISCALLFVAENTL